MLPLASTVPKFIADIDTVQTDSTREKTLELHIQSRVTAELEKLRERESRLLKELEDQISNEPLSSPENPISQQVESPTSTTVHESIASLRSKLASRRKLEEIDESVEKAKNNVVRCLRENDRRPLDCWREVEAFRREVGRLERNFVEKVIG
jgi:MICOS complex subunit MIC19